jgi:uncharacterized protein YfkK (UPF0435 family)
MAGVNLKTASEANLAFIVNEIKTDLKIVNAALISPKDFSLEDYEYLLEIYQLIKRKQGQLTMMEIDGVLEELRSLRKS